MNRYMLSLLSWIVLFPFTLPAHANEISAEELERWFNTDSMEPPRYKDVNEGQLVFLASKPKEALHHHHNTVTILPNSLSDGWILVKQCHSNIDRVGAAQVLFKAGKVKGIKIVSAQNIERTWVEGASVQMENVKNNATLCIEALTQSLQQHNDGTFSLRNGPFMRRFLDGYYPLQVSLDLNYAQTDLELIDYSPSMQTGFNVERGRGNVKINTIFEGRLQTEFHFKPKKL